MLTLQWPLIWLLLPLPLLIYWLIPAKKTQQAALFLPRLNQFNVEKTLYSAAKPNILTLWLMFIIWLLLLAAASNPQRIGDAIELPSSGRDVFLAVDISGSMQIDDMVMNGQRVDRLTMVKHVLSDFIAKREGDRLGLILFGSNAYLQAPLTFDLKTVAQLLQESLIGFAGQQTAIGDAIGLAIKRLATNPADSRVVILLTDGANNAGNIDPIQAAKLAKQTDVVIHTIAFGSDQNHRGGLLGLSQRNYGDDIDEKTLKIIADTTGGRYFRARNQQELREIYQLIDQLERRELDQAVFRPVQSLFYWPLLAAMLLFAVLLGSQRHRRGVAL